MNRSSSPILVKQDGLERELRRLLTVQHIEDLPLSFP
jgi:hypothetical protein